MRRFSVRSVGGAVATLGGAVAMLVGGSGITAAHGTVRPASKSPITIGVSLAESGDFSGDGKDVLRGYDVWKQEVNSQGGISGHPVQFIVKDDQSSTQQTLTNYQTLIGTDHVDFVFGPYSSLLTIPAESVAKRYGYLMLGPAGGAPAVFAEKYKGYAFVQPEPVVDDLVSLASLILSLPKSERPKTVAYATSNDPFTEPQFPPLRKLLSKAGVKSVYFTVFPDETPDLSSEALAIISSKAQAVVLGTTAVPQVQGFVQTFIQQHYSPKILIATSGPDQGSDFSSAIGANETEGIMVPESWTPTAKTYQNARFVREYLKMFGGSVSAIPQDASEAYSVGQVFAQLAERAPALTNAALIKTLHGKTPFKTDQGPMTFGPYGQPSGAGVFLAQWKQGATKIVWPKSVAQAKFEYPKPGWH